MCVWSLGYVDKYVWSKRKHKFQQTKVILQSFICYRAVCLSVRVSVQGGQCVSLWDTVCVSVHGVRCVSGKTKLTAFSALVASSLCGTTLDNTFLTVSHGESLKQRHILSFTFHRSKVPFLILGFEGVLLVRISLCDQLKWGPVNSPNWNLIRSLGEGTL